MTNLVRFDADVDAGPSPIIFGDIGKLQGDTQMGRCVFYDNDFIAASSMTTTVVSEGIYPVQTGGGSIAGKGINDNSVELGVIEFDALDDANDESGIQIGLGNQYRLDTNTTYRAMAGMEVRFLVDDIAVNSTLLIAGFVEGPIADDHIIDSTGGAKNSTSFVGFQTLRAAPQTLVAVMQNTATAGVTTILANAGTLVVNTYSKVGVVFDPFGIDDEKLAFVVNGAIVAYCTDAQLAANFPLGEGVVPCIIFKDGASGNNLKPAVDRITSFMYRANIQG